MIIIKTKKVVRIVETKNKHYLIAISYIVALLIVTFYATTAFADVVAGTVTYLSGPLFAKKADGSMKTLSKNSVVEQGDTLVTEKRTYARVKFNDGSEVTLRPESQFKIEVFSYNQDKPKEDKAVFELVKGGLRALSGHVGKRGDPDSYKMKTPPAVIGIRGTIYEVKICAGNCGALADGIYFFVPEGTITVSNTSGSQTVGVGQYAYAENINLAPVLLPGNPGIDFTLPENIQATGSTVGCMVR
jgi:hypothetical protein